MIQDIDESLRALVKREALEGNGVDVAFDAPTKEWVSRRNAPTVDLYLYDIREDLSRRETTRLLWELLGVRISLGAVSAIEKRVSESVAPVVDEIVEEARKAPIKHGDGTSWLRAAYDSDSAIRPIWALLLSRNSCHVATVIAASPTVTSRDITRRLSTGPALPDHRRSPALSGRSTAPVNSGPQLARAADPKWASIVSTSSLGDTGLIRYSSKPARLASSRMFLPL